MNVSTPKSDINFGLVASVNITFFLVDKSVYLPHLSQ